jgi:hypothetical protein
MSEKQCHVQGCSDPIDGRQIELRVPLDQQQTLSQLSVRTWVCSDHRHRFTEAGLVADELSLSL